MPCSWFDRLTPNGKSMNNQYTAVRPELAEGLKMNICLRFSEH